MSDNEVVTCNDCTVVVTGDYAVEKIKKYIKDNKQRITDFGKYHFEIFINDMTLEIYTEDEFDKKVACLIKKDKIYNLYVEWDRICIDIVYIVSNDEEWEFYIQDK